MPAIPFKLFGLQGSGTNLARLLLLQAFEVASLETGHEWKHGYISAEHRGWMHDGQPVRLIICVKNPYAWLVSCYNYFVTNLGTDPTVDQGFRRAWGFAQFVQYPSYNFKNPIDRWNSLIRHWLEFPSQPQFSEIILQESMLDAQGQQSVLARIETNQHLSRKNYKVICETSRRVGVEMRLGERFDAEYYRQRRYLAHYSGCLLDFVNQSIDMDLFRLFGYEKAPGKPS
jgi:hypothetical protein